MNRTLREFVVARAANRCEYCRLDQADTVAPLEVEHVIARKHHGATEQSNLCLACLNCNQFKGANIAGIDPASGSLVRLFHPRIDVWEDNFEWSKHVLVGLTDVGRATIDVLKINAPDRVALRRQIAKLSQ